MKILSNFLNRLLDITKVIVGGEGLEKNWGLGGESSKNNNGGGTIIRYSRVGVLVLESLS